jgi:hypothetical protein
MRPVQITSGRHPFEVATLVAVLAAGVALLATGDRPKSVTAAMPILVQATWEIGLIVAGVVGLAGITWRGRLSTALGVELGGVACLGTVTTMYAIALAVVTGTQAIAAGAIVGGLAVASWWRIWQIVADLRRIARAAEAGAVVDVPLLVERDR